MGWGKIFSIPFYLLRPAETYFDSENDISTMIQTVLDWVSRKLHCITGNTASRFEMRLKNLTQDAGIDKISPVYKT